MNFQNHYFKEAKATPRKGIQHVYGGDEGKYSMKPNDFMDIIKVLKNNKGKMNSAISNVSEKADGFALKFGLNPQNKFFIESSHSKPIFDRGRFRQFTIQKKGSSDPISEGYEDILKELSHDSSLQKYLKSINTNKGVKIHTEAFYMPLGKVGADDTLVKFVATWYKKEKMGSWATFVVLNVTDAEGNPFPKDVVEDTKNRLEALSTDKIKFEDTKLSDFQDVDLTDEIEQVDELINTIETEFGKSVDDIITDSSRKKDAMTQKKKIKQEMLKIQKEFSKKLGGMLGTGKFGNDYEGLVFELANGVMFKVVSDRFKEAKKSYNRREDEL